MKSIFAPSARFLTGLLLAAAAVGAGSATSRPSRSADALIEELGAPSGEGFDDIVVKLAPLVPAKPAKDARPAERPPAPQAVVETPPASAVVPPPSDSSKPAAIAPFFLREALPVVHSAPAEEIAKEPPDPASAEGRAETIEQSPREAAEPARIAEPEKSQASAAAETEPASLARPPEEEQPAQEESRSPLAFWQELVAALALAGLLATKYVRRGSAPPKAPAGEPAPATATESDPAASGQSAPSGRFAAIRAKIAALRGGRGPSAEPKPKISDWTEIASALRRRFAGAEAAAAPGARERSRVVSLVEAKAQGEAPESWAASEEDAVELLEPGDASARAIVMNARRRLRSAQS
jgi:hypothetical protein